MCLHTHIALPSAAASASQLLRPRFPPQALAKWFGAYRPGVMGMSMDESAHLLYRLLNGEVPKVKKVRARGYGRGGVTSKLAAACMREQTLPRSAGHRHDRPLPAPARLPAHLRCSRS